jgi:hypothetical protein
LARETPRLPSLQGTSASGTPVQMQVSGPRRRSLCKTNNPSKSAPTNPHKQFIKDLIEFINKRQSARHEIILNLDANEVLGEESQGIIKLMHECDLLHLLDIPGLNNDLQLQDTYHRGNK